MSDRIEITVRGRLGADPLRRVGANGTVWATFRLGASPSYRDAQTGLFKDGRTEWFTVKAWGNLAANVLESVHRATPVVVRGKVYVDTWTGKNGERWDHVIHADTVAVDLSSGTANFVRTIREAPAAASPAGAGAAAEGSAEVTAQGLDGSGPTGFMTGPDGDRWESTDLPPEPQDHPDPGGVDADEPDPDGRDLDEAVAGAVGGR